MASLLIRDIPKHTVRIAKRLARMHRRSLQEEIRGVLISVLNLQAGAWSERADRIRQRLARMRGAYGDSVALLREDRRR